MKTIFMILILLPAVKLCGQNQVKTASSSGLGSDISLLETAFGAAPKVRLSQRFSLSKENPNELQAVFSGLFLVYKAFFSSQDNQRCSFHPSCSEFGLEAVKRFGVIRGVMCTCDRLTRCNGFSPRQYEIDFERRRLKDPVSW